MSDINHKDCMNHSILDAGLIVYHTLHPPSVITLPLASHHPFHPLLLVEALKHCLVFSFKQIALKSTLGLGFSTATLLLKTAVCCLYFEHFSCGWQLAQDRLCISTLLRHQIGLLINIPSHEGSTLFHQLLAFEASIPGADLGFFLRRGRTTKKWRN